MPEPAKICSACKLRSRDEVLRLIKFKYEEWQKLDEELVALNRTFKTHGVSDALDEAVLIVEDSQSIIAAQLIAMTWCMGTDPKDLTDVRDMLRGTKLDFGDDGISGIGTSEPVMRF